MRIYQDQLNPVAEVDSFGNIITRFVYGSRANVPDYLIKDSVVYKYITDHLGSVRFLVNLTTGEIVQELDYDEFGKILKNTNKSFQPFAYAGGLYDHQTGMIRFGSRDYDAQIGRWTAKDPIGFDGSFSNLYLYVKEDPINYFDPVGLKCKRSFWQRTWDAYKLTNKKVPGFLSPPFLSTVSASSFSKITESITFGKWVLTGGRGITMGVSTFTALETGIVAAATSLTNYALIASAYQVGIGIGSMISAAILPCLEENTVIKIENNIDKVDACQ
jgi:RHS repeat-associated protein